MSDRELFMAMLSRAGVQFTEEVPEPKGAPEGTVAGVRIEPRAGWPNAGYSGFLSDFWFAEDGRLLGVGIWE